MEKYRFDGRVAVVTGAGRGIGRAYAHLLGELGAKVVVNDLGGTIEGSGSDANPAQAVAQEIIDAGGVAVADTSDISTVAGGKRAIETARELRPDRYRHQQCRNVRFGGLPDVDVDNIESHLAVHVKGAFNTSHAAWPHMLEQNYGRIVITTSIGMFGLPDNTGYATAKAAVLGMANSMTLSAGEHDIKINVIAPNAMTRMGGAPSDGMDEMRKGKTSRSPRWTRRSSPRWWDISRMKHVMSAARRISRVPDASHIFSWALRRAICIPIRTARPSRMSLTTWRGLKIGPITTFPPVSWTA
ncbi:hypothetical protein GCM10020255_000180 [Rhodococcus baikonurensis]